jgi:hypothetical protein
LDQAYWISWYDLPEERCEDYLAWLKGTYLPAVLERRGVYWAAHYASEKNVVPLGGGKGRVGHAKPDAVPGGNAFITIFGASGAHVFAEPSPSQFHARFGEHDRRMLALRAGERVNVMVEQSRADGPELAQHAEGMAPAACIQLGSFNMPYEDEDEMLAWYAQWRLPSMSGVRGCVRVRKLVSVCGWAKHACLYEFTSVAARNENFVYYERDHPEMESWSKKVVRNTIHAPGSANVAQRVWLAPGA